LFDHVLHTLLVQNTVYYTTWVDRIITYFFVIPTQKAQYLTSLIHCELYSYYHYYTIASQDWLRCSPTLLLLNGYRVFLSPEIKQQGCEAGHLSPLLLYLSYVGLGL